MVTPQHPDGHFVISSWGMTRPLHTVGGGWLLLLLATCVQVPCAVGQQTASQAQSNADPKPSAISPSIYAIGTGDVLHISVWDEPQLTETATVRPDGKISLPLLYDVTVAGMTPDGLQKSLTEQLTRFVRKPRVTVTVQEIHSRMVFITGEVQRPGAYPLVAPMNVVQLIARSGGLTDFARQKRIYVLRADKSTRVNVNYEKVLKGHATEENVDLAPGDTVVVP